MDRSIQVDTSRQIEAPPFFAAVGPPRRLSPHRCLICGRQKVRILDWTVF